MQVHNSEFNPRHGMIVVLDSASPFGEASVENVLIPLKGLFEQGDLILLLRHFDKLILLSFKLLSDWDLLLKLHTSLLKLEIDVGESDGVETSLEQHFSPNSVDFLNHERFLFKILLLSIVLAPALPLIKLVNLFLSLLFHDGKLHTEEDFLLEPHVSNELVHFLASLSESFLLGESEPVDKGSTFGHFSLLEEETEQVGVLSLILQADISPVADVGSHNPSLLALGEPSQNIDSINLLSMVLFSLKEGLAPSVEELSSDFAVDIESNQILILVVLMHEVHGVPVPSSDPVPLPLNHVVLHGLDELVDPLLQVLHLGRALSYLLQGMFGPHIKRLSEDLEQQFCGQKSDVGLISLDDMSSLSIHSGHVVLIPSIQLVHLSH